MGLARLSAPCRARCVLAASVFVLAAAVAVHHTGVLDSHAIHEAPELALCLAIVGGVAIMAPRRGPAPALPRLTAQAAPASAWPALPAPLPRARAGPPLLQVFRL